MPPVIHTVPNFRYLTPPIFKYIIQIFEISFNDIDT